MAITLDGSDNKIAIGANATSSSAVRLYEDTDNGTNYVDIIAPSSITSNRTLTLPDATGTLLTNSGTEAGAFSTLSVNSNNISAENSLGFRNRIINGDMRIDQRNAGASVTIGSSGTYTLDRWRFYTGNASKISVQQSTTAPTGFVNSLLVTSLAATSITTTDEYLMQHRIEGNNIADLAWGTASAKTVTLSFWVRSSLTGTFGGVLRNSNNDRCYPFTYTISSANTYEYKTITVAGDTSGTWETGTGVGINVFFGLGVGSTYSGTAGSWSSNYYSSATGAVSLVGTNGATLYITGVQLEVGSVATPFERMDYGRELIMCQRYFFTMTSGSSAPANDPLALAVGLTSTEVNVPIRYPTTMRTDPTVYSSLTVGDRFRMNGNVNVNSSSNPTIATPGEKSCNISIDGFSGLTVGYAYTCRQFNVTGVTGLDAEL